MCIGFSVDFSAHISYHFLAAKDQESDERIRSSLKAFGTPIIQVISFISYTLDKLIHVSNLGEYFLLFNSFLTHFLINPS
jgi:hypothetical protein